MKITLYLYHEQYTYAGAEVKLVPWHVKLSNTVTDGSVRIFIKEVEVELPEVTMLEEQEVKQAMVAGFYQQKKDLQAEVQQKLNDLDDKIQQLLAISYNPDISTNSENI